MKKYKCPKCGERYMTLAGRTPYGKPVWRCRSNGDRTFCYRTTNPEVMRGKNPDVRVDFTSPIKKETLVITWAQNATPVHKPFFNALLTYCKANNAQMLVIPGRYKNPTSRWEDSQANAQWWAPELVPYLVNKRTELNKNLMLLADIRVQPTAVTPLTGFEGITQDESGILGHPKLQMTVISTPHQKIPKILTTTGAVTVANYSDTKAGKKGDFHHVLGAAIIEMEGDYFHLRHANARKDGAFCDLNKGYYSDGNVRKTERYAGLVFGDTHVAFTDPAVDKATFDKGGLVELLNPQSLVFHDLLDSYAVNPHHEGNPFIKTIKHQQGRNDVREEIKDACEWVEHRAGKRDAFIIASNHNDFLARWMRSHDWRSDPENAELYLQTALDMIRASKIGSRGAEVPDPFQLWAERFLHGVLNVKCVGRHESLMISGIECSLHGDEGPNGSRGSRANLSKIGAKTIIGHTHTPGITDGCYQTGTSTPLSLEYTGSVGSWLNAHVSIDPMGKRHIHVMVNGKFWR